MELINRTKAPIAAALLGGVLLAGCSSGEGRTPHVDAKPSGAATTATSAPAVVSSCKLDSMLNQNGWGSTAEYGAAAQQTADQYHLNLADAKAGVVDCKDPVPETDVMVHRAISVEGVSGTCALLGTVSLVDGTPEPGNHVVVMCWGVKP
ncbi:MAG TPA: hypothetical protein VMR45_04265 [Patescibacteria group bacterium]|nr:hypothetical protein [Patescibacteria group bacterium]